LIKSSEFFTNDLNSIISNFSSNQIELILYNIGNSKNFPLSYLYRNSIDKEISEIAFNEELILKNLSVQNQNRIVRSIKQSNNEKLKLKYEEFLQNKKIIVKLNELGTEKRPSEYFDLILKTELLEKYIVQESSSFNDFKKIIFATHNQIKDKLKNEEVVINIVSYKYYDRKPTDSLLYSAFIIGKNYKFPKFISLFEEKQLDFLLSRNKIQQDSTLINKQYLNKAISDLFLKPLEKELEGISTIYLSPSGLGHQINFAALPVNENQTLGNKYKLHILSSPAELIDYSSAKFEKGSNLELLLYGGIDYDKVNPSSNIPITKTENNGSQTELQTRSGITGFGYLKGSKKEVEQIQFKGTQSGFKTTLLNDRIATEESIKQLDGRTTPFILHLATHGFFFPDPIKEAPKNIFDLEGKSKIYKASDDPMMRSGLLFSGANKFWGKTTENTTTEDGILTASEISNLDLSACQLVVLSACETGLGEVKGSEGVFGLQRAFKMAGVKNIIMSLWKVPDAQTAELFEIFYAECFAGKTIHQAFQSAQTKMKEKYSPYYWAGFVLLE
jgi:CHAT domain-containing protein